jgi:hypothetical protein
MSTRLMAARLDFHASRKVRFIDFKTGSAWLQEEHRRWLDETLSQLQGQYNFWIDIVGFASKLPPRGSPNSDDARFFNSQLSYARANEVARYLEARDKRVTARIREFAAHGSDDYKAAGNDNSPEWRAVEVHINYVAPPPPPPDVVPLRPLPGGARCSKWGVAAPFGVTFTPLPGLAMGGNVIVFRCLEGKGATHAYLAPGVGGGLSYSGPDIGKFKGIIKTLLGSGSYTGMSFTETVAVTPFNFKDLDGATCDVQSAGAGVVKGYLLARVSVRAQVWYRQPNGKAMFGMRELVTNVDASGKDLQIGVGGSVIGGPLIRMD